jgi:hypothetical protein
VHSISEVEQKNNCINKIFKTGLDFNEEKDNGMYKDITDMNYGNNVLENTIKYIELSNKSEQNIYYVFNEINSIYCENQILKLAYEKFNFVENIFFEMKKNLLNTNKNQNKNKKIIFEYESESELESLL